MPLFLVVVATFDAGDVRCPFPSWASHWTDRGSTCVDLTGLPPMLASPWRGFAFDAELDLWAKAKGDGGPPCPISVAYGCTPTILNVVAPGWLSKVPPAPDPEQGASYLLGRAIPRAITGHTAPLHMFLPARCKHRAVPHNTELIVLFQTPRLHRHGTFTCTHCTGQFCTAPSPHTNQSPHSNPFLLQFKVLWHFIWKIL